MSGDAPSVAFDRWRALQAGVDLPDVRLDRPEWHDAARCRGSAVDFFASSTSAAKAVCSHCAVQAECLAYAMADPLLVGVWGGTSTLDRRAMRRKAAA